VVWRLSNRDGAGLAILKEPADKSVHHASRPDHQTRLISYPERARALAIASACRSLTHLALYDQSIRDKYQLAKIAGGNISSKTFIVIPVAASNEGDIQSTEARSHRKATILRSCSDVAWCS
jgi:hypothetical protein